MPSRSFYAEETGIDKSNVSVPVQEQYAQITAAQEPVTREFLEGHKVNRSSYLENQLQVVREKLYQEVTLVQAEYYNLKAASLNEWNNFVDTVTSVYDPRDKFLPNFNYALTALLTGSILANKRSFAVRFITPLVIGTTASKFFLPRTFDNTLNAIKNYEAEKYPEVLSFQRSIKSGLQDSENSLIDLSTRANEQLVQLIHDVRVSLTK